MPFSRVRLVAAQQQAESCLPGHWLLNLISSQRLHLVCSLFKVYTLPSALGGLSGGRDNTPLAACHQVVINFICTYNLVSIIAMGITDVLTKYVRTRGINIEIKYYQRSNPAKYQYHDKKAMK